MRSDFAVMKDLAVHTRLTPEQRQREVGRLIDYIHKYACGRRAAPAPAPTGVGCGVWGVGCGRHRAGLSFLSLREGSWAAGVARGPAGASGGKRRDAAEWAWQLRPLSAQRQGFPAGSRGVGPGPRVCARLLTCGRSVHRDDNVQRELRDWGLSFDSNLLSFSGRVLQAEKIHQGGKTVRRPRCPGAGGWGIGEPRGAWLGAALPAPPPPLPTAEQQQRLPGGRTEARVRSEGAAGHLDRPVPGSARAAAFTVTLTLPWASRDTPVSPPLPVPRRAPLSATAARARGGAPGVSGNSPAPPGARGHVTGPLDSLPVRVQPPVRRLVQGDEGGAADQREAPGQLAAGVHPEELRGGQLAGPEPVQGHAGHGHTDEESHNVSPASAAGRQARGGVGAQTGGHSQGKRLTSREDRIQAHGHACEGREGGLPRTAASPCAPRPSPSRCRSRFPSRIEVDDRTEAYLRVLQQKVTSDTQIVSSPQGPRVVGEPVGLTPVSRVLRVRVLRHLSAEYRKG